MRSNLSETRAVKICRNGNFLLPLHPNMTVFRLENLREAVMRCALTVIVLICAVRPSCGEVTINNPILPGFNPDPTITRVGDDYYICTSSFTWFPGLPIYHSTDLEHWELIAHAIDRPDMVRLEGEKDKDGVYAPTLRCHDGTWYLFSYLVSDGIFYLTADTVTGPWSDPIYLKDAPGIDPFIFWDDDGRAYLLANAWGSDLKKIKNGQERVDGSCAIWIQEIDLTTQTLKGEKTILTSGHAVGAKSAEGPRLYKRDGTYWLVIAEGGTDMGHAVTAFSADSLLGPYSAQRANPVMTHRHIGIENPIQCVGHADIVETAEGECYAVMLAKRMTEGKSFTRETFMCPADFRGRTLVLAPGKGMLTMEGDGNSSLTPYWYTNRIPKTDFYTIEDSVITLTLQPETVDSLTCPAMLMQKVTAHKYTLSARVTFTTKKAGEKAGIILHRTNTGYIALMRTSTGIEVIESGKVTAALPYEGEEVVLTIEADGLNATLLYGAAEGGQEEAARVSLRQLADGGNNRFNGVGMGVYATSTGKKSKNKATFKLRVKN